MSVKYKFQSPDGRTATIDSPDGSLPTEDELNQIFKVSPVSESSQNLLTAKDIASRQIPIIKSKIKELQGIYSKKKFWDMPDENLLNTIDNYQDALKNYNDTLSLTEKPGFWSGVGKNIIKNLDNAPEKIPFLGSLLKTGLNVDAIKAEEKLQKGEPVTQYEESLLERYRAARMPIDKGLGYAVTDIVLNMPTYITEFAMTGGVRQAVSTPITKLLFKTAIPKIARRMVALGIGAGAQSLVNVPEIAERFSDYLIPAREQLQHPEFKQYVEDEGPFMETLTKAVGTNAVEYITEYAGALVNKPIKFVMKSFLGKAIQKKGLNVVQQMLKKGQWDGIIGEVAEEELAELGQAPLEKRPYKAPFATPEGTERLLVETLGIGAFQGIATAVGRAFPSKLKEIREKKQSIREELPVEPSQPSEVQIPQKAIDLQVKIGRLRMEGKTEGIPALQAELDKIMGISAVTTSVTAPAAAPELPLPGAAALPSASTIPLAEAEMPRVAPIAPLPSAPIAEKEIAPPKTKEQYDAEIKQINREYQRSYKAGQINKAAMLWQDLKSLREQRNVDYPVTVKPTTIIGWIKTQGGINPKSLIDNLGKDIQWIKSNYPLFKIPGLLSAQGSKDLVELYENAVNQGIILPLAESEIENYPGGVGTYFLEQIQEGVGRKLGEIFEEEEQAPPITSTIPQPIPDPILASVEAKIGIAGTQEEIADIADILNEEMDDTNQAEISRLFELLDENQQRIIRTPLTEEGLPVDSIVSKIERAGGKFKGISELKDTIYRDENDNPIEPTVYFDDAKGSTKTLPLSKVTPENLKAKLQPVSTPIVPSLSTEEIALKEEAKSTIPPLETFRKVLAGDYNVRYIDSAGQWWKQELNGKFVKSKPMPIKKEYGDIGLQIEENEVFGKRVIKETVAPEVTAEAIAGNSDWLNTLPAKIKAQWDNPDELYNILKSVKEKELDFADKKMFDGFMNSVNERLTVLSRKTVKSEHVKNIPETKKGAEQLEMYSRTNVLGEEEKKEVEAKKAKIKAKEIIARDPIKSILTKYEIDEKDFMEWTEKTAKSILWKETNSNANLINENWEVLSQDLSSYVLSLYDSFKSDKKGKEALDAMRNYIWNSSHHLAWGAIRLEKPVHVSTAARQAFKENPNITEFEFAQKFPKEKNKYDGLYSEFHKRNQSSLNQQIYSTENSAESTLGDITIDPKSIEPEFETDNEIYRKNAEAAFKLLQKTLSPFELKIWQDYVMAIKKDTRPGETPELVNIIAKIKDVIKNLRPEEQILFANYTFGELLYHENKNIMNSKGEVNLRILSMGMSDNLQRVIHQSLDLMQRLGYDKKLLAKEIYRSIELPADMAMKSNEFGPIFRLGQKIRTYERSELESIVFEDKMEYFKFEKDKDFQKYKDIAMGIYYLGTRISTKNKTLTREDVKNLMLMELKKYPDIATTIFNTYYNGIRYIQEVVLAEKFRYAYQYYTPNGISGDLFMKVLEHVSTFDKRFKELYEGTKAMVSPAIEELVVIMNSQQGMVDVYRQMVDAKIRFELDRIPFYYPIQRYGFWALKAVLPSETGEIPSENRYFSRSDSKRELLAERDRLKKEGWKIQFFGSIKELVKTNMDLIKDDISLFDFEELLQTVNLNSEEQQSESIEKVRTYLMTKGFSRHWLRRTLAEGFKTDYHTGKKTYIYFADSAITSLTNTKSRILLHQEIAKINDPVVKQFAWDWLKNMQNMSSTTSNLMRLISTMWYLSGKITFGVINMHQLAITLYPLLQYHLPGSAEKIFAQMGGLMINKKYINIKALEKSAKENDELAIFLLRMAKQGILRGNLSNELMSAAIRGSKGITILNSVANLTEHFNWKGGAIAGYLLGKKLGFKEDALYDYMVKTDEQANFIYGPINLPLSISKQKGLARTVLLAMYQFHHFWTSYFTIVKDASRGAGGGQDGKPRPDVFLRFLGVMLFIGGISSFPFFNDINNLLRKWYGIDIKNEIYRRLPRVAARAIVRGAESALLGVDLSGLVGFGEVFNRGLLSGSLDLLDLMAFGGIIKKSQYAAELLKEGETYRAIENASPRAIAVLLRGARWIKEGGIRKIGGGMIYRLKSPLEGIVGMAGFMPIEAAEQYEIQHQITERKRLYNDKIDDVNRQFALGIYYGENGRTERAIKMMDNWNKANPDLLITINNAAINRRVDAAIGRTKEPRRIKPLLWELEDLYGED